MKSPIHPSRSSRARMKREGAVMLVVMLVVLMVTATGMFAVYSTTYELRSAGTFRTAMQTEYLAEGGISTAMAFVDVMGAGSVDIAMQRVPAPAFRQFAIEEPAYAQSTPHFRVYMSDFATAQGVVARPIEWDPMAAGGSSLGSQLAYGPNVIIDWDDAYRPGIAIAGMSVTGDSPVSYRVWTITSRGRTAPLGGIDNFSPAAQLLNAGASPIGRGDHETAMNARAVVLSGPL